MLSNPTQIDELVNWLYTFDFCCLQNEDDVETKFVIPLFCYLGYPDKCRRGKYPLKAYNPGKPGRKPEIDNVYFSTDEAEKQGSKTSLLLVEAKEAKENHLEKHVEQAVFYADKIKTLFYVVTNGHRFMVFKRHRYHDDDCILDIQTSSLVQNDIATRLYRLLHFEAVRLLKDQVVNELTHDLHIEVMRALSNKPDLLAQIAKGDFKTFTTREGRKLVVSKPKVAVECELPLAFRGGSCRIEFSNVMLRGLVCQLTHDDVVRDLLVRLHTPPHWKARRFIEKTTDEAFEVHLGQTTVLLSEQEALELCACIDVIGDAYKEVLVDTTELLGAWDYTYSQTVEIPGFPYLIRGLSLISVKPWLWELMKEFAQEFNFEKGQSEWHIFDMRMQSICICSNRKNLNNVTLWPVLAGNCIPNKWVDILYYDPDEEVEFFDDRLQESWKQFIGPQGLWTLPYTHEWLTTRFVPQVLSYYGACYLEHKPLIRSLQECIAQRFIPSIYSEYKKEYERQKQMQEQQIIKDALQSCSWRDHIIPFSQVSELKHLASYLHAVQSWLLHYGRRPVATSHLKAYYEVFTEITKHANTSTLNIGYILGKLGVAERRVVKRLGKKKLYDEKIERVEEDLSSYEAILYYLDKHVCRLQSMEYEDAFVAEIVSRVFIAVAETSNAHLSQDLLNRAIEVIQPLWKECRFDYRYIRPLM